MLSIGWPELLVIAVVTVLVVGPREIPRVLRTVTLWARKARELARDFQTGLDDLAREADVEDLKRDITDAERAVQPLRVDDQFDRLLDPDSSISAAFSDPASAPEPAKIPARTGEVKEA